MIPSPEEMLTPEPWYWRWIGNVAFVLIWAWEELAWWWERTRR